METAFLKYCQLCDDQTAMENSGEVIARLCSALMRMPNVAKITVSPNIDSCLDDCGPSSYVLEPEPEYDQAFLLIARVLSHTDAKVRQLDIRPHNFFAGDSPALSKEVFQTMSNMDMRHCCNAFRGLRKYAAGHEFRTLGLWNSPPSVHAGCDCPRGHPASMETGSASWISLRPVIGRLGNPTPTTYSCS
jgi:hypothetical protein